MTPDLGKTRKDSGKGRLYTVGGGMREAARSRRNRSISPVRNASLKEERAHSETYPRLSKED